MQQSNERIHERRPRVSEKVRIVLRDLEISVLAANILGLLCKVVQIVWIVTGYVRASDLRHGRNTRNQERSSASQAFGDGYSESFSTRWEEHEFRTAYEID